MKSFLAAVLLLVCCLIQFSMAAQGGCTQASINGCYKTICKYEGGGVAKCINDNNIDRCYCLNGCIARKFHDVDGPTYWNDCYGTCKRGC
ncbi:hypothetical protein BC940DRAFT_298682 [Gongronella butleri]|nr:hypothetical protein BC940DRAFT_298682 [Gongronella butleri]